MKILISIALLILIVLNSGLTLVAVVFAGLLFSLVVAFLLATDQI